MKIHQFGKDPRWKGRTLFHSNICETRFEVEGGNEVINFADNQLKVKCPHCGEIIEFDLRNDAEKEADKTKDFRSSVQFGIGILCLIGVLILFASCN